MTESAVQIIRDTQALGEKRARELGLQNDPANDWKWYSAEAVHRLLGEGVETSGWKNADGSHCFGEVPLHQSRGSKALLIGIRPLVKESAESLLHELIERNNAGEADRKIIQDIHVRAKKLLEG